MSVSRRSVGWCAAFLFVSLTSSASAAAQGEVLRRAAAPRAVAADPLRQVFRIESCNLGCVVVGEEALGCSVSQVFVNQEFRITFSQPFDPASVDPNTLVLVDVGSGAHVPLSAFPAPLDPHVLIARPRISFDASGNPVFGLRPGVVYSFRTPGALLDPIGPHIRSLFGRPNLTLLTCAFTAKGVADVVPGAPAVSVRVDIVESHDPVTGEPDGFAFDKPAHKATDVWRGTDILFVFGDLMLPRTLLDPKTGLSSAIRIAVDPDGNVADASDQVPVAGSFVLAFDQVTSSTRLTFDPASDLPSAGRGPTPLKVVVGFSKDITDLVGNRLLAPQQIVFVPDG